MKNKIIALIGVFIILPTLLFSQFTETEVDNIIKENNTQKLIQANTDLVLNGNHLLASKVAKKLVEQDPNNANFNYRLGYSLIYISPFVEEPLPYLEKAIQSITKEYDVISKNEKSAPMDAYFHYATVLLRTENISGAKEYFNKFLASAHKKSVFIKDAELGLKYCNNAALQIEAPKPIELKRLTTSINSTAREFAPIISFDGKNLFFTSTQPSKQNSKLKKKEESNGFLEDIYVTSSENDTWSTPKMLDFCKPNVNEATVSVSIDERRVYLFNSETGNGDIYYTQFNQGNFSEIKIVTVPVINSKSWEPHLTVSPNGKTLFFVSDRPGGFGGRDIYYCIKKGENEWSEPINAGATINTAYDEDAPFVAYDNATLYFASNNEKSIGGFDIFKSKINPDYSFEPIENLGYPINSTTDDIFYSTTADGVKAYISSFRKGGIGDLDIYEITNDNAALNTAILKGQITVIAKKALPEDVAVTVNCLNCPVASSTTNYPRLNDGIYFVPLEKCKDYELIYTYSNSKKVIQKELFSTNCEEGFEEVKKSLTIQIEGSEITPANAYTFKGKVSDKENHLPLANAKILVKKVGGELIETVYADATGLFNINYIEQLKQRDKLEIELIISKDNYITTQNIINESLGQKVDLTIDVALSKNQIGKDLGKIIVLNTIYFDLNSSYLRKDAKKELDQVIIHLNLNPTVAIECGSHTDCRESETYNQWLSERRANRTKEYIQKKISNPSRVTAVGYGESKLINHCACDLTDQSCSEEQHQLNRRTEFIILSK